MSYRKSQSVSEEEADGVFGLCHTFSNFFRKAYNPEKKELWGRTALSWAQILGFYVCFYSCLILFCSAVWFTWFRVVLNADDPIYFGDTGFAWTPGMTHMPIFDPDQKSTLIRYTRSNTTQVDQLREFMYQNFLSDYEPSEYVSENGNFIDCTSGRTDPDPEKVCEFKLDDIRPCVYEDDYGWFEGEPCIILKLNRINDWEPENYESIEEVPDEIKDVWQKDVITVQCAGADPVSKESLGDVAYYPQQGWSFDYYPFIGQQGYKSPLVAVQFLNLPHRALVFITCKAYTKNMIHHSSYRLGMTRFELMSD